MRTAFAFGFACDILDAWLLRWCPHHDETISAARSYAWATREALLRWQTGVGDIAYSQHPEGFTRMAHPSSSPQDHRAHVVEYTLPGHWKVLVGRTDADNDDLSFQVAQPEDWWFHVRGMPGSHVILQGPPGAEADRQTLTRAAAIAAYHSKARNAGVVAVSGTRARDVTKPRGAKAGTVQIRHERVFKVRPARGDIAGDVGNDSA